VHGLSDKQLADLARMSVRGSVVPQALGDRLLAGIDEWLTAQDPAESNRAGEGRPGPAGSYSATPTSTGS
jgi:adenosine deaminase